MRSPPRAPDGAAVADDLHPALRDAGESGPLVVVGHSVGGAYAPAFTQQYGDEVAGLVLIDTLRQAGGTRTLGDRPLIALAASRRQQPTRQKLAMEELHRDIASWSSAGRHETVGASGSYIHNDQPEAVIAAVRDVIEVTR